LQNGFTLILAESKQKMWAIIKQQWVLGLGGMQYNVYAFGGHAILSAFKKTHGTENAVKSHASA
jgi:hypothetical protein